MLPCSAYSDARGETQGKWPDSGRVFRWCNIGRRGRKTMMKRLAALGPIAPATPASAHVPPAEINPAIYTDPPHDKAHPPGMEVLHIPSGAVKINGVAYTAAGAGTHPVLVLMHGLPGNEKNLDLAQAVRRAGW